MLMRPGRRMMRRRSLVGAAATTAVVVGTAGAVSHHQQEKYAGQAAAATSADADVQQQPVPNQSAPPPQPLRRHPPGMRSHDAIGTTGSAACFRRLIRSRIHAGQTEGSGRRVNTSAIVWFFQLSGARRERLQMPSPLKMSRLAPETIISLY